MVTIDSNKTKALLFDFDGTLVLSERVHYENFKEVLKTVGINLMPFNEFISEYSGKGGQFILNYELEKFQVKANIENLITLKKTFFRQYVIDNGIELTEGTKEILIRAKEEGFKIGLVTGGFKNNFETILEHSDLPNVFDVVITNEDIKEPKPSPFGYLLGAERLGVASESCVVFEDAVNGIDSAQNAGMRCIALSTYTSDEVFQKHYKTIEVIKDFSEISLS
jgi:beta-phosphoglucomutase